MNAINFNEANSHLGRPPTMTEDECHSLHVFTDGTQCISKWRLTWRERIKALLFGTVWLSVYSGHTQPPVWVSVDKTVFGDGDEA